jgi:hypothetical protein
MSTWTLSDGTTTLAIPYDLVWTDEGEWNAVEQTITRGLTGALIIQQGIRTHGRPITLEPDGNVTGWWPRSHIAQAQTWADAAEQVLTLTWRGVAYTVQFRHEGTTPGFEWTPLRPFADPSATDHVLPTFRLITVPTPD